MTFTIPHLLARIWELLWIAGVYLSRSTGPAVGVSTGGVADEQLVAMWRDGNRQGFEALVRRYQNLAFSLCMRTLGNAQLAEETAQETFVTLFRKVDQLRDDSLFRAWLIRALVNNCRNSRKAGARRKDFLHDSIDADPDDGVSRPVQLADERPDPERALSDRQRMALFQRALQGLEEDDRTVLLLRDGHGMAEKDIAEALGGIALGTVKSRIHRARAALKQRVERLMRE